MNDSRSKGTPLITYPMVLAAICAFVPVALAWFPDLQGSKLLVLAASFVPHTVVVWVLVLIFCIWRLISTKRLRYLVAAIAVTAVAFTAVQPYLPGPKPEIIRGTQVVTTDPKAESRAIKITAINLMYGQANTADIVAATADSDIVMLVEITPEAFASLRASAFTKRFQHWVGKSRSDAGGSMLFATKPLTNPVQLDSRFDQVAATVPTKCGDVTALAVHPVPPTYYRHWVHDSRALANFVQKAGDTRIILAGDFNATNDHISMRRLFGLGLQSAAQKSGAGWQPTWRSRFPLLGIDHALSRGLIPTDFTRTTINGTDHLAISATYACQKS